MSLKRILTIEVAPMQRLVRVSWHVLSRHQAECFVKLELIDVGGKVSDVAHVGSHVIFGTRVEGVLITLIRRGHPCK